MIRFGKAFVIVAISYWGGVLAKDHTIISCGLMLIGGTLAGWLVGD